MDIVRYKDNPILTKDDVPFKVNSIFNAGAIRYKGKYLLVCRIEMPIGRSSFVIAKSDNGYDFKVADRPCLTPEDHKDCYAYVNWGIEDPRITQIGDKYFLLYTGYSKYMPLVILAETQDFQKYKILGSITEPSNKDAGLFPEKIGNYYWKVDRPSAGIRHDIWINKSPDLIHWGDNKILMEPEKGTWEGNKIGGSTPPIKTKEGWLMLYHGVRGFGISSIYKIGAVFLDLEKPWIVKGRTKDPILSPDMDFERIGDVQNVAFSNGWIPEDDGEIKIYYSGADMNICLATTTVDYLLSVCE